MLVELAAADDVEDPARLKWMDGFGEHVAYVTPIGQAVPNVESIDERHGRPTDGAEIADARGESPLHEFQHRKRLSGDSA